MSKSILNKNSLIFLFILGVMVLVSVSILTYMNMKDQTSDHNFISSAFYKIAILDNISSNLSEGETSRRGYYLSEDVQYITDISSNKTETDSLLKQIRVNSLDNPNQLANAEALKPMVNERFALFNEGIELQKSKGTNSKFHKPLFDRGKILNIDIKNLINKMKREELKNLDKNKEKAETSLAFTIYTFFAGIGASVLIFLVAFISLIGKASKTFAAENQEISREELEQIIKERTAEISQINQKLYSKVGELEKMEETLKNTAEQYRRLFEQAHDAILIYSPVDGKIINVNRRACDLYGFKREELVGLTLQAISKNMNQCRENIDITLEKGYYHNFQSVHYKKDLTEMLMEINASVFSYNGNKVILSINRDITDRILKMPE